MFDQPKLISAGRRLVFTRQKVIFTPLEVVLACPDLLSAQS